MATRDSEQTNIKKARRVHAVRLFLYVSLGLIAGLMLSALAEYGLSLRRPSIPITPVPSPVLSRASSTEENLPTRLNLNTATWEELRMLPGIGDTYARAILDYRDAHGRFFFIEELMNIPGIGSKRFEKVKDRVFCGE
ncbi:MAG: ComEA family DNA-binding protein [Clostridia bacterium]|nr:ComEA family DNA-binding protein [Clostridia bacterium]